MCGPPPVLSQFQLAMTLSSRVKDFLESLDITTIPDPPEIVDELKQVRKRKMEKVAEKTPPCSKNIATGDISQCLKLFRDIAKSLIESRKSSGPPSEVRESMKATIEILNYMDSVEVASRFG